MFCYYQTLVVGTELHTDPEYTSPWNTVFSGYKWLEHYLSIFVDISLHRWVLLPPEVLPEAFVCDADCSDVNTEDDINIESWYSHVLPQLRGRSERNI